MEDDWKLFPGLIRFATATTLLRVLLFMTEHGQSVTLNWGEDDGLWECSWITSGERFTALHSDPLEAARHVGRDVLKARQ